MNRKVSDGWILCPSKSFPGKFYYFNVVNGEAAWCLTDAEKKALPKDSPIKRVSDRSHSYPEPNTPPVQSPTSNICYNYSQPNIPFSFMPTPQIFGQPVFPKYFPNEYMPYMLPMPQMFVPNKPEKKKRVFDQITQTSEPDRDMFVQTGTMSLSKRFSTYQAVINTKSPNKQTDALWWEDRQGTNCTTQNAPEDKNNELTVSCKKDSIFDPSIHNEIEIKSRRLIKAPVLNTVCTKANTSFNDNISEFKEKQHENRNISIQEASNHIKDCKKPLNVNVSSKLSKDLTLKVENISDTSKEADLKHLNSNDLRYVLDAKRRKSTHSDTDRQKLDDSSNFNNSNKVKKEKKVTFDLGPMEEMDSIESEPNMEVTEASPSQVLNISYLKSLSEPYRKTDPWYIVVDMGVLLDDFEFVDDFVKKDITCRLLVPNSVCAYIKTISVGEYAGRDKVMLARKAIRRLTTPGQHVIVQPATVENVSTSAIDGIIDCCYQIGQGHHVVLITTDTELYNTAVSSNIQTYNLDDIKNSIAEEPEVVFDIKRINVKINNNVTQKTDLTQNDSNVFKVPSAINKDVKKKVLTNACTSPINFDKIIDITWTRRFLSDMKVNRVIANDEIDIESSIEEDIRNLTLQGNSMEIEGNNVSKKFNDFNFQKSIVNTNFDKQINNEYHEMENILSSSQNTHKYGDLNFQKSIINTNFDKQSIKIHENFRNSETKQIQKVIMKPIDDLKDTDKTSEFKTKSQIRNTDNMKQSKNEGNRLQINAYTIEDMLKKFIVKESFICGRIACRMEEWICCFVQVFEDFLGNVLTDNSNFTSKFRAPWTLQEAIHCIRDIYTNETAVKTVAEKMTDIISNLSDKNDNLNKTMKSADFMKLFGCGVLLVESLKAVLPNSIHIQDTEERLKILHCNIKDPSTDVELPVIHTPLRRSEVDDIGSVYRNIGPKKSSEIISYLKKHFAAWKEYNEEDISPVIQGEIPHHQNPKIIRTFGKDLNTIKIDNAKQITYENAVIKKLKKLKENIDEHNRNLMVNDQTDGTINDSIYFDTPKCVINSVATVNGKEKTEIIRNFNPILGYEENIKNTSLDMEAFDFSENDYLLTKSTDNIQMRHENIGKFNDNFVNDIINDEDVILTDDESKDFNDKKTPVNDFNDKKARYEEFNKKTRDDNFNDEKAHNDNFNDKKANDDFNDSGIENESLNTCSFIRTFLTELSASFKIIYGFVDESIQEFRCDYSHNETKRKLYDKANETHLHVADIIGKLKRIIEREGSDNTKLKSMIINAGVEALTDKRMTRYRQVVTKCLEQAQLLEGALKTMLALSNEHSDVAAVDLNVNDHNIRYFNIFE